MGSEEERVSEIMVGGKGAQGEVRKQHDSGWAKTKINTCDLSVLFFNTRSMLFLLFSKKWGHLRCRMIRLNDAGRTVPEMVCCFIRVWDSRNTIIGEAYNFGVVAYTTEILGEYFVLFY